MKVYVQSPAYLSRAMERVANALARTAPPWVEIVNQPDRASLHVLHVVGDGVDALKKLTAEKYAVIQYCYLSASRKAAEKSLQRMQRMWRGANLVWSYYDLQKVMPPGPVFYYAPLGIDDAFLLPVSDTRKRPVGIMSSGYVAGSTGESIEEVAEAALIAGLSVTHLGPVAPTGMRRSARGEHWRAVLGIDDSQLSELYRQSLWVSGLRRTEGFELPVIEGLSCGARPIVFDRPDMRQWYDGHAVFVQETNDPQRLIVELAQVLAHPPEPVLAEERHAVRRKFDWKVHGPGFWNALERSLA